MRIGIAALLVAWLSVLSCYDIRESVSWLWVSDQRKQWPYLH